MVRLDRGTSIVSVPIYLPEDRAIPAPGVPAKASFTRPFVRDKKVLQREQKSGVPAGLALIAYLTVLAIVTGLFVLIGWVLLRLEGAEHGTGEPRVPRAPSRSREREPELV
jgi:hypothetical protein